MYKYIDFYAYLAYGRILLKQRYSDIRTVNEFKQCRGFSIAGAESLDVWMAYDKRFRIGTSRDDHFSDPIFSSSK